MTPEQQTRIRELPTLIEGEKNHDKAMLLVAELSTLLELEAQERQLATLQPNQTTSPRSRQCQR